MNNPDQPAEQPSNSISVSPDQLELNSDSIRIGELWLSSSRHDTTQLCQLAIMLLSDEAVREYLDLIKTKKKMNGGGYIG